MRRMNGCFAVLMFVTMSSPARGAVAAAPHKLQVIEAEVRTGSWDGWAGGGPAPDVAGPQRPEKFERFETPAGEPPTFGGKVVGIPAGKAAQVCVVANVGTQWISKKNYKYAPVAPDGSFTITADHKPDAKKSLMVAIDGRLATFLRAEFAPRESAKDVEIELGAAKTVVLTMENQKGHAVRAFQAEIFNASIQQDAAGRNLRIQRLAAVPSSQAGVILFQAPVDEPVAVLISSYGLAPFYTIIDPREADEFRFKMLPAGRVKGVVTRDGRPVAGETIYMSNPSAALSAVLRKTDARGRFDINGRPPGQQYIRIGDYRTTVYVEPGETAELDIEVDAKPAAAIAPVTTAPTAAGK